MKTLDKKQREERMLLVLELRDKGMSYGEIAKKNWSN